MIPVYVKPFLWSYDVDKLDLKRNKRRIITNVLNLGILKATDWLFDVYDREEIKEIVASPSPGEWSKKSLNFWSIILGVTSKVVERKEYVMKVPILQLLRRVQKQKSLY